MAKVALLIGVSEYEPGLDPLPGAVRDIKAMRQVLQHSEMGGFDEVKTLSNPNSLVMQEAIESLFANRTETDLVLLFFSGHAVKDERGNLYFATRSTLKSPKGELVKPTAVAASFLHDIMSNSGCNHQVVILDCCFSAALAPGMTANARGSVDIKTQLGGQGRVLLTSFTSTQYSFSQNSSDLSVYTRYLVEGIQKGTADLDGDGWISVDELHNYANRKVQEAAPAVKPEFYSLVEEQKIILAKAQINDPGLEYRKEAERRLSHGNISPVDRYVLNTLAWGLGLTTEERAAIEAEVLKPHQEYQEKLQRYARAFMKALQRCNPLSAQAREELTYLREFLGLRDEDVAPIEEQIALRPDSTFQFEADANNEPTQSATTSKMNGVPLTPSVVPTRYSQTPAVQPTNQTNSSSSPIDSGTSPPSVSTFPKKFFLMGIGGGLAILALAIGISARVGMKPPAEPTNIAVSPPAPSSMPSPTATSFEDGSNSRVAPSPKTTASPKRKSCSVVVIGNVRSQPAPFRDNVIRSLSTEQLPVTGKQTEGGWIEVKLSKNSVAWVHRDVISNEKEMDSCLSENGVTIKTVDDIPLPEPSPSP